MKKIFVLFLTLIMLAGISSCGSNGTSNTDNQSSKSGTATQNSGNTNKILVAYFSYSGNTKTVAEKIQKNTNAEIFRIETKEDYPSDYDDVVDKAQQEQDENARPELKSKVENLDDYDVIFLGYPNWWGTMPMALFTFWEENNLDGKTIVPFCTHEGSELGRSEDDIKSLCSKSTIKEGLAIRGSDVNADDTDSEINKWIENLNL